MSTGWIILIVIMVIVVAGLIALFVVGNKLQKKSEASQAQLQEGAQTVSLLIIDKKYMKLKEAGLPKLVLEQTPKYLRRSKVPIVKVKAGPKILTMMCDQKIFDLIPVKKEVKAVINGIYIIDVKGLRTGLEAKEKKAGFFKRMTNKIKGPAVSSNTDSKKKKKGKTAS